MGNTPNNNFPFPESTDLVKDGAQAIEDLADAIDTTLGVYAPVSSGLTLINTTSFSGVSSQSVNDVFSATYKNYKIVVKSTCTGLTDVFLRLRVAGSDNSATNYRRQDLNANNTSITGTRVTGATSWTIGALESATENFCIVELYNPFHAFKPVGHSIRNYSTTTTLEHTQFSLGLDVDTSYTGYTILVGSGTISGSVSTYGYNV
jgi:hypothetical protein